MAQAIEEAALAPVDGDVPVGALLLDASGAVVSRAHNEREAASDPLAHAEILALRRAAAILGHWRLDDCSLVVTLEPCTMCAGAIAQARVGTLVFGAFDPKAGAVASLFDVLRDTRLPHRVDVVSGILADECARQLQDFFRERR